MTRWLPASPAPDAATPADIRASNAEDLPKVGVSAVDTSVDTGSVDTAHRAGFAAAAPVTRQLVTRFPGINTAGGSMV